MSIGVKKRCLSIGLCPKCSLCRTASNTFDSSNILYSYCLTVEELIGIQVPERGKYLRAISAEIYRINHASYWLAILGIFVGHSTMFMWTTADRELFVELADMASGQRIRHAYLVPGSTK
jgi:NADH-quinone oxidoreductase subunit D